MMSRMSLLCMLALCSCSSQADPNAELSRAPEAEREAQMAGEVRTVALPETVSAGSINMTATISAQGDHIILRNFTSNPVRQAQVWINRQYVQALGQVPPYGQVEIHRERFVSAEGEVLPDWSMAQQGVQLQVGERLYDIEAVFAY